MKENITDKRCDICGKLVEGWHRYDYDGNPICDNCCINLMQGEIEGLKEQLENSVQLPCKVGDTIYEIRVGNRIEGNCIFEHKVRAIHLETNIDTLKQHYYLVCGKDFNEYFWEECYKNYWFSTKPEAEARLKELNKEIENER